MRTPLDLAPRAAEQALGAWLAERGEPAYRIRQLMPALWRRPVRSWAEVIVIPRALRAELDEAWPLPGLTLAAHQVSRDGTLKFLWALDEGGAGPVPARPVPAGRNGAGPAGPAIESVLIPSGARRTLCISSQVGCALNCAFCATGAMGFSRNLATWEIAAQVRELVLREPALAPTNVVFMGMGEPLLNWEAVDAALSILNDPAGFGIGARHITVSTVGILPALAALARRPEQFRLAISLHAATSARRGALMPIERKYPLPSVVAALAAFRRRVTFEYVMIAGANDADEDLEALAELARGARALVNLLPLHPGGAARLSPSPPARMRAFAVQLRRRGIEAVLRRSRGLDIAAACGQLRAERGAAREVAAETHAHVHQAVGIGAAPHHTRA